jgi:hypothetical protein
MAVEQPVSYVAAVATGAAALTLEGAVQELRRRQQEPILGRDISAVFVECVGKVPEGRLRDEYLHGFFSDVLLRTPPEYGARGLWEAWGKYQRYLYECVPRDPDPALADWVAETTRIFTTLPSAVVADRPCQPLDNMSGVSSTTEDA